MSLIDLDAEFLPPGTPAVAAWKRRLASILAKPGRAAAPLREFELAGVGPAAWMTLVPSRPDVVTLLAMRPVPASNAVLFLQYDASAGREEFVEPVFGKVAASWTPGTPQGFSTGPGAFVAAPSINESALASFADGTLELSIATETSSAPHDGLSTGDALPPGARMLARQQRTVAGLAGIEERIELPKDAAGAELLYWWVFPGHHADGIAPRIRFTASAPARRAGELDAAWNTLMASWRPRPVGAH